MEEKESKTIDLETNPQRIVLVNKNDTEERLKKLEKKAKIWKMLGNTSFCSSVLTSGAGFLVFFGETLNAISTYAYTGKFEPSLVGLGIFTLGIVAYSASREIMEHSDKLEKDLQKLRETVALREEAKNNPNIVIKEKSENLTRLEKKLNRFKPEAMERIGTAPSAAVGLLGGLGGAVIGGYMGAAIVGGITGGLCYLPFSILAKIAKKREDKLKKQIEKTIETDHPDFYRQEMLAEIKKLSEASKRDLQAKEQEFVQIDATYKNAQKCDSTDTLKRLLHLAQNPQKNNVNSLNLSVLSSGKGIV